MNKVIKDLNNITNGDDVMSVEMYTKMTNDYFSAIDDYISQLKSKDMNIAKKEARDSLYESGVITKDGKLRKKIVTR